MGYKSKNRIKIKLNEEEKQNFLDLQFFIDNPNIKDSVILYYPSYNEKFSLKVEYTNLECLDKKVPFHLNYSDLGKIFGPENTKKIILEFFR